MELKESNEGTGSHVYASISPDMNVDSVSMRKSPFPKMADPNPNEKLPASMI